MRAMKSPGEIAHERSLAMADGDSTPDERQQFMAEFGQTFLAARQGLDLYGHWRAIQGNDAWIAGFIEGVAAARRDDVAPLVVRL